MTLFIDTETTGLPRTYYAIDEQPHVVQVAAVLCDDSRQVVASMNRIIRPQGWVVPMEATAIHGYTTEYCRSCGIPLTDAMQELHILWKRARRVVAYNAAFDTLMLKISSQRTGITLPARDAYCAMQQAAKVIGDHTGRWLRLDAAYARFFGRQFENAHDAMADVDACRAIYHAIEQSVAPVARVMGDIRGLTRSKLQKALVGIEEIEDHQHLISSFISLHHTPARPVDWRAAAATPLPISPTYERGGEEAAMERLQAYRPGLFARLLDLDRDRIAHLQQELVKATEDDRLRHEEAMRRYRAAHASVEKRRRFAHAILSRNVEAYNKFLDTGDMFESPLLARNVLHSFIDGHSVEVFIHANGPEIIPMQTKKLLASGRVSTRKVSKSDFVALYQDHICSAVLRIARDFFAVLPLDTVLAHAYVPGMDTSTGHAQDRCILSCIMERSAFAHIAFESVDPSDCIGTFAHAMRVSRGELREVTPLDLSKGRRA